MIVMINEVEDKKYCVYVHISPNGKIYVGQTSAGINKRWGKNGAGYLYKKDGKYIHPAFAPAILKYGWDNFQHEVIADNLTREEADSFEKLLIEKLNTMNPEYGYNCKEGGSSGRLSEESCKKISDAHKGIIPSDETRKKMSEARKGMIHSEETKKKIGDSQKGESHHMYGNHHTEETRRMISESLKGRILSEETKKKISDAQKGEKHHMYGKHHTEETKKKLSDSHIGKQLGSDNPSSKKVSQYDKKGHLIMTWECMKDASKKLEVPYHDIYRCCKNELGMAGGFIWRYYEDKLTEEHLFWCNEHQQKKQFKKSVVQYSLSGELIKMFESMAAAESETDISQSSIGLCCRGKRKTAGGFIWKYYDDMGCTV